MHPSSLVFVVVIAIWAAYVTQHWVRRRDHLVTARSVDRFSDAMRLLETRPSVPAVPAASAPRSYVGSPTRATRVTRAQEPEESPRTDAVGADAEREDRESVAPEPSRTGRPGPAPRADHAHRRPAAGLSFLVALTATLVTAGLVVAGLLPVWVPLVGVAATAGSLLWVRRTVAARQRARSLRPAHRPHARPARPAPSRRTAHDTSRPGERGRTRPAGRPAPEPSTGHAAAGSAAPVERHDRHDTPGTRVSAHDAPGQGPARADEPAAGVDPDTVVFDVEAGAPTAELPAVRPTARAPRPRPQLDEDDMPLTWDPVPVPRPTYTMKARAYRPAPVQQPAPVRAPEPARPSEDADESGGVPAQGRRVVGG